ncbi:MAG: CocE/NonD family hydrolase [Nannocystaceae bacterium]
MLRPSRIAALALPLLALACRPPADPPSAPATPVCDAPAEPSPAPASAGDGEADRKALHAAWIAANYDKREVMVPMRDGVELFTQIYTPKSPPESGPPAILFKRTPYSISPYGEAMPRALGPSDLLAKDRYVFVYQDVRGRFMSGGEFVNVRPHNPRKRGPADVDESTDTYDTIAWLLANVDGHNGRVGMWGISYPGFYAAAGMIDHHPALVAVSPQAPIADWYFDDFYHHGAFFLPHFFNFFVNFGRPQERPAKEWGPRFDHGTADGFAFFLDLGALSNVERYFRGEVAFWQEMVAHPTYDAFWAARNLLPHLKGVAPAVMVVGGLFDAEDLYGPLSIYRAIERQDPDVANHLVMGPWAHGGWARSEGDHLGNVSFGAKTSLEYQADVERVFFDHYLRGDAEPGAPSPIAEATIFNTGADAWRRFETWPPEQVTERALYLGEGGVLAIDAAPPASRAMDRFVSDPARPVPSTEDVALGMTREYMTDDQRFAARRPDVLTYQTAPLTEDLTLAGPLTAELWVATSERDADWVVKLVDVFPDDADDSEHPHMRAGKRASGYQMMVRSEVLRGRYRDGYERARPFTPNKPTAVKVPLQDVLHTFKAGHRIMIQIQSTWFPMVDRNPQRWVENIFEAKDDDFRAATHTVFRERAHPSRIVVGALPARAD